ncbi:hypothetical protein BDV40DRAFT_297970 [Aspergillus tamarii]|uniref:Uncharacterized protein n=1 Tax=Aspergillus tamarii TaxID=41984 RepID=A0A5N6V1T2_ASPTM|nr:hypothetical protein BDV40DRAFT_297970 [Aspergillus tamarii]
MNDQHNDRSAPQPNPKQPRWAIPDLDFPQEDFFKHKMRLYGRRTEEELERKGSLFSQGVVLDVTQNNLAAVFVDIPKNPISTRQAFIDAIEELAHRVIGRVSSSDDSEPEMGTRHAGHPDDNLVEGKERVCFMYEMDPHARLSRDIAEDLYTLMQHAPKAVAHMSRLEKEKMPIEIFRGYTMTKADPGWTCKDYDRQYAIAKPYKDWAPCEALRWLEQAKCSEIMDLDG